MNMKMLLWATFGMLLVYLGIFLGVLALLTH